MSRPEPHFHDGALGPGDPYIERPADAQLHEALRAGEFAYVLAPRKSGKTSLLERVSRRLEQEDGVRCLKVDLSGHAFRTETLSVVLRSLATQIARDSRAWNGDAAAAVAHVWEGHADLSPLHLWREFLTEALLPRLEGRLALFIDEIESIKLVEGGQDAFFASIRALYNERARRPDLGRLTVCLFGVYERRDLLQEAGTTPYNIGREIRLDDLTREQTLRFAPYVEGFCDDPEALLEEIFRWTTGQPLMTQTLLREFQRATRREPVPPAAYAAWVDRTVERVFLSRGRNDVNIGYSEVYLVDHARRSRALQAIDVYRRLLAGEPIDFEAGDADHSLLYLSGLAGVRHGAGDRPRLGVRNAVYARVYDIGWVREVEQRLVIGRRVDRWTESDRSEDHLLTGAELDEVIAWTRQHRITSPAIHEFLFHSLVAQRRNERAEAHRLQDRVADLERSLDAARTDTRELSARLADAADEQTEGWRRHRRSRRILTVTLAVLTAATAALIVGASYQAERIDRLQLDADAADDRARAALAAAERENGDLRDQLRAARDDLEAAQARLAKAEADRDRALKTLDELKATLSAGKDRSQLVQRALELQRELAKKTAELDRLHQAAGFPGRSRLYATVRQLHDEVESTRQALGAPEGAAIAQSAKSLAGDLAAARRRADRLTAERDRLQQEAAERAKTIEKLRAELDAIRAALAKATAERDTLARRTEAHEQALADLRARLDEATRRADQAEAALQKTAPPPLDRPLPDPPAPDHDLPR